MRFEYVSDGNSLYLKVIMKKSGHLVQVYGDADRSCLLYIVDGFTFEHMDKLFSYLENKYE